MRIDISINYYIRFSFACQAIAKIPLFYLIFSFYYFLFVSSNSFLYANCVLVITISYHNVKRCRAIIPRLKPWDFPHGIFKLNKTQITYIAPVMPIITEAIYSTCNKFLSNRRKGKMNG